MRGVTKPDTRDEGGTEDTSAFLSSRIDPYVSEGVQYKCLHDREQKRWSEHQPQYNQDRRPQGYSICRRRSAFVPPKIPRDSFEHAASTSIKTQVQFAYGLTPETELAT